MTKLRCFLTHPDSCATPLRRPTSSRLASRCTSFSRAHSSSQRVRPPRPAGPSRGSPNTHSRSPWITLDLRCLEIWRLGQRDNAHALHTRTRTHGPFCHARVLCKACKKQKNTARSKNVPHEVKKSLRAGSTRADSPVSPPPPPFLCKMLAMGSIARGMKKLNCTTHTLTRAACGVVQLVHAARYWWN